MIGKGFDIPNVSLVGVILADLGLHIPDFRTPERIFQLLTQVADAPDVEKQGEVIIQTYNPNHPSIFHSQTHNYLGFYEQEISSRKSVNLPPYERLVKLMFVHEKASICEEKAQELKSKLILKTTKYSRPRSHPSRSRKIPVECTHTGCRSTIHDQKLSAQELEGWRIDVDPLVTI